MATISTDKKTGRRTVQFKDADGKRKSIRLGKVTKRQADSVKFHMEHLIAARITGHPVPDQTAHWVAKLDANAEKLADDLAKYGLIQKTRRNVPNLLGDFIDHYVDSRTDVKPATKEVWRQGKLGLLNQFGNCKRLPDITAGDADTYKAAMLGSGLASFTVKKRIQFAKTVFRTAVRHRLISSNPFADVKVEATMTDRMHFVTRENTAALLAACRSMDWRLIVGLSRFGGFRCPSEVVSLKWKHVDWKLGEIIVTAPKTERYAGHETRRLPLFPELRELLSEARKTDCDPEEFVVDKKYRKAAIGRDGWRNVNLRTTFEKIIERAGLVCWPRLFHNLRSSRETELLEEFPIHVVAKWFGHSVEIAAKHYAQVTDEHFERARATRMHQISKAVQNPVQHSAEPSSTASQSKEAPPKKPREKRPDAASCGAMLEVEADGVGFEPTVEFPLR